MLNIVRNKWRNIHLSENIIKLSVSWRFDKNSCRLYSIKKIVPNLVIIGSQKCGTSSLCVYLNEHPEIYMSSPIKEPGYFIFKEWAKDYWKLRGKNIKSKKELLKNLMISDDYIGQKYFGDGSTHYTIGDRVHKYDIASTIKKEVEKPKILYIIRNPFERITSSYYHAKKSWEHDKVFDVFLEENKDALKTTQYFEQIKPYIDKFKSDVLLLKFEDLIINPQQTLDEIYRFLNLEPYQNIDFKVINQTRPNKTIKISSKAYHKLAPIFFDQKDKIQNYFNEELDWDLSEKTWIDNNHI